MTDKTLETLKALRDAKSEFENLQGITGCSTEEFLEGYLSKKLCRIIEQTLDDAIKRLEQPISPCGENGLTQPETVDLREMKLDRGSGRFIEAHESEVGYQTHRMIETENYNQAIDDIIRQHKGKVIT